MMMGGSSSSNYEEYDADGNYIDNEEYTTTGKGTDFMALPHLTPMPLIGGGSAAASDWDTGSLYSAQIASMVAKQAPEDRRVVVVGLGPELGPRPGQELDVRHRREFLEVVKLVEAARVW